VLVVEPVVTVCALVLGGIVAKGLGVIASIFVAGVVLGMVLSALVVISFRARRRQ